jgi:hypothetical protein
MRRRRRCRFRDIYAAAMQRAIALCDYLPPPFSRRLPIATIALIFSPRQLDIIDFSLRHDYFADCRRRFAFAIISMISYTPPLISLFERLPRRRRFAVIIDDAAFAISPPLCLMPILAPLILRHAGFR